MKFNVYKKATFCIPLLLLTIIPIIKPKGQFFIFIYNNLVCGVLIMEIFDANLHVRIKFTQVTILTNKIK